jgi:hypothetical protein
MPFFILQDGSSALHFAGYRGYTEIVKNLLQCQRFTQVNAKDNVSHVWCADLEYCIDFVSNFRLAYIERKDCLP